MRERSLEIALAWAEKNHVREISQVLGVSQQIYNFLIRDTRQEELEKTIEGLENTIQELKKVNADNLIFKPRDYQSQLLEDLEQHDISIVCHAIKLGITRTIVHYIAEKCQQSKISVVISSNSHSSNCEIQQLFNRELKNQIASYRLGKQTELINGSKIAFWDIQDIDLTRPIDIFWVDNAAFISHQVGDVFYKNYENCFKKPQKTIFSSSLSDRNGFFYRELNNIDFKGFRTTLKASLYQDETYQEMVKLAQLSNPIEKFSRDYCCKFD